MACLLLLLMLIGNQVSYASFFFLLLFYSWIFPSKLYCKCVTTLCIMLREFLLQVLKKVDILVGHQQIPLAGGILDHLEILQTCPNKRVQWQMIQHFLKMPWLVLLMIEFPCYVLLTWSVSMRELGF